MSTTISTPNVIFPLTSLFVLTPNHEVLWVQDQFSIETGYQPSQIIGHPLSELGSPTSFPQDYTILSNVLNELKVFRGKVHFKHSDGSTYECLLDIRPFFDENRQVRNYIIYGIPAKDIQLTQTPFIENHINQQCQNSFPHLDINNVHHLWSKLLDIINNEGMYRTADLKLKDLAYALNTNRTYLSKIIHHFAGFNFNHLINQYRVTEVRKQLILPENQHLTIDAIGEKCGFGGRSTFHRVFKEFEGLSPKQFKKRFNF